MPSRFYFVRFTRWEHFCDEAPCSYCSSSQSSGAPRPLLTVTKTPSSSCSVHTPPRPHALGLGSDSAKTQNLYLVLSPPSVLPTSVEFSPFLCEKFSLSPKTTAFILFLRNVYLSKCLFISLHHSPITTKTRTGLALSRESGALLGLMYV